LEGDLVKRWRAFLGTTNRGVLPAGEKATHVVVSIGIVRYRPKNEVAAYGSNPDNVLAWYED
jgi:hypothetical protein